MLEAVAEVEDIGGAAPVELGRVRREVHREGIVHSPPVDLATALPALAQVFLLYWLGRLSSFCIAVIGAAVSRLAGGAGAGEPSHRH